MVRRRVLSTAAAFLLLVIAGVGLFPLAAAAQAVGGWDQAQGDAAHTGYAADAVVPPYREAWDLPVPLGGPSSAFGLSAPAVAGSTVVAVGTDRIVAADLATGRQLWSADRDDGPPVSPAIASAERRQVVIFTEGFGSTPLGTTPTATTTASSSSSPATATATESFDSHVAAIDVATHEPAWDAPVQLDAVSRTGVTVEGDTAFVGDNRGNVFAIDVSNGTLRWKTGVGGTLSNPLASIEDSVIATVQGGSSSAPHVVALRASDGSKIWDHEIEGGSVYASSPAIADGRVVVASADQTVRAFDLADGSELWAARINNPVFFTGAPAITPDAVLVVDSFGQVYRFDPATGERAWDYAINETVLRSPVVVAGNRVLVATVAGRLVALDMGSGDLVWQGVTGEGVLRGLTPTSDVVVGVRGGADPGLVAFADDPEGSLVSLVSPTTIDLPQLLLAFFVAAVPIALLLSVGGRALRVRMGPAFLDDDEAGSRPDGSIEDAT
jgi:outer membrane protein assembly factor BamB